MGVYLEMEDKGWLNIADVSNAPNSGVYGKMWEQVNNGTLYNSVASRRAYLGESELRNTDWFGELFRSNIMHNHSVSMTTGGDKATMYASVSALVDPGWTLQSKVNRYTANINTTYNIHPKLSLNVLANASLRNQRAPGTVAREANPITGVVSRDFDINPYSYALNSSRTLDPRAYYVRNYAPFNIFHELDNNYLNLKVVDLKFQGEFKYKPLRGLELALLADVKYSGSNTEHTITEYSNQAEAYRAMGTTTIRNNNKYLYTDPYQIYAEPVSVLPQGGFANRSEYSLLGWDTRLSGTYSRDFGAESQHILNTFAGIEVNSLDRYNRTDRVAGILYDMGGIQFMDPLFYKQLKEQGGDLTSISNSYYRNVALFANATYSYRGKYTVNGTLRYEGSNKMGKSISARWLPTWNTSFAWNVHEESWFAKLEPLSSLTLKASYSLTADKGPSSVTNSSIIVVSSSPWRYPSSMQQVALEIANSENNKLTYEKKHELNLGFEAGLWDGRLNLAFDWYRRNNFDLIGPTTTLGVDGQVIKMGNVASMNSSGVEFSLSSTNIKTKDFRWVTDFVYSYATNKVTKLNAGGGTNVRSLTSGTGFAREGYPVGAIFSIPFAGLNEEGLPTFYNETGARTIGEIDFQERQNTSWLKYEGTADPKHFGSLGNTLTYKGWHLNVFLTYAFGSVVRLDPVFASEYDDLRAMPKEFDNRWVAVGDEAHTDVPVIATREQVYRLGSQVPRQDLSIAYSAYNYSTARIAKGDFVRLKEVSLSYDFPQAWAKALFVSSLSLKLQASNLMLLYADKRLNGQDPEFLNAGGVATPLPRQFTMTLRVGI
ncbi:MAG: TonB-dependent receptor, partial [Porphyromonas sp.]|nr:TonB-dependent receptor [Porphyromonas sp.]